MTKRFASKLPLGGPDRRSRVRRLGRVYRVLEQIPDTPALTTVTAAVLDAGQLPAVPPAQNDDDNPRGGRAAGGCGALTLALTGLAALGAWQLEVASTRSRPRPARRAWWRSTDAGADRGRRRVARTLDRDDHGLPRSSKGRPYFTHRA